MHPFYSVFDKQLCEHSNDAFTHHSCYEIPGLKTVLWTRTQQWRLQNQPLCLQLSHGRDSTNIWIYYIWQFICNYYFYNQKYQPYLTGKILSIFVKLCSITDWSPEKELQFTDVKKKETVIKKFCPYFFSPSSWTCSSSFRALCHHPRRRCREARGDVHHVAAMVLPCDTTQEIWWDWSPRSWGCGPRPLGAQPCAALQGCCWGAGSTPSWLPWPYYSARQHSISLWNLSRTKKFHLDDKVYGAINTPKQISVCLAVSPKRPELSS